MIEDMSSRAHALEELQARLIADVLGISANEVTIEFIDHLLETKIYPRARFNRGSAYGGYTNAALRVYTGEELASIRRSVDEARKERAS
jgi:hypothetical protein